MTCSRVLRCLILSLLLVGAAPPASAADGPPGARLDLVFSLRFDCVVDESFAAPMGERDHDVFRADLVLADSPGTVAWSVECFARGESGALGTGGLAQDVRLEFAPGDVGAFGAVASCRYDGVLARGCFAGHPSGPYPFFTYSGVLSGARPVAVEICIGPWIRGVSETWADGLGLLGRVEVYAPLECSMVPLRGAWTGQAWVDSVGLLLPLPPWIGTTGPSTGLS